MVRRSADPHDLNETAVADLSGQLAIPATGDWQLWTDVTTGVIALPTGAQTLTLVSEMDGVNFNYVTISL